MNQTGLLPDHLMQDAVPLVLAVMMVALVVVPAVTFGIARKWSQSQPDIATAALGGAVIVSVVAIAASAFLALALIGWLPPLNQISHAGG